MINRILIAEDVKDNAETLSIFLNEIITHDFELEYAYTLEESFQCLSTNNYDLVFLDIQFQKGTIFSVLDKLVDSDLKLPPIIFITAYSLYEYLIKAIQFSCLDYINKPISKDQILRSLERYESMRTEEATQRQQLKHLIKILEEDLSKVETVAVRSLKNQIAYIKLDDIIYIKADGPISHIHTQSDKIVSVKNLGYYIELFNDLPYFIQLSRALLVNENHIIRFNPKERLVQLSDGSTITASHRMVKNLKRNHLSTTNYRSFILTQIKRLLDRL